ncbi:MAG: resolvase [Armatimonadota bacterium]|nr:resolvase [Armatimonadota bacterium]
MSIILSIDPGRDKCGLAVVSKESVLHKEVAQTAEVPDKISMLTSKYDVTCIIIGSGTGSAPLVENIRSKTNLPIEFVNEHNSTLRARIRFFEENPPKGLLRLIPKGMLTPNRPYDDYVAVILAEDFMKR